MTLNNSQGQLVSFVERIERLIESKKEILSDIADVKAEAKGAGFEPKVINQMIKERAMSEADRQEWNALCELCRAALGILDGAPMSDNARRRFDPPEDVNDEDHDADERPDTDDDLELAPEPARTPPEVARRQGADAFHTGSKITANPFDAHDPARAAWDEGYCAEAGSDGMDIPPAWRRSQPKKDDGKGDDA